MLAFHIRIAGESVAAARLTAAAVAEVAVRRRMTYAIVTANRLRAAVYGSFIAGRKRRMRRRRRRARLYIATAGLASAKLARLLTLMRREGLYIAGAFSAFFADVYIKIEFKVGIGFIILFVFTPIGSAVCVIIGTVVSVIIPEGTLEFISREMLRPEVFIEFKLKSVGAVIIHRKFIFTVETLIVSRISSAVSLTFKAVV